MNTSVKNKSLTLDFTLNTNGKKHTFIKFFYFYSKSH